MTILTRIIPVFLKLLLCNHWQTYIYLFNPFWVQTSNYALHFFNKSIIFWYLIGYTRPECDGGKCPLVRTSGIAVKVEHSGSRKSEGWKESLIGQHQYLMRFTDVVPVLGTDGLGWLGWLSGVSHNECFGPIRCITPAGQCCQFLFDIDLGAFICPLSC